MEGGLRRGGSNNEFEVCSFIDLENDDVINKWGKLVGVREREVNNFVK